MGIFYSHFTDWGVEASVTTRIHSILVAVLQLLPSLMALLSPTTDVFLPVVMGDHQGPTETVLLPAHVPKNVGPPSMKAPSFLTSFLSGQ